MFNIELLRGYYDGAGVKIALIDTGISNSKINEHFNNVYNFFYDYNTKCINISNNQITHSSHGNSCAKCILDVSPMVTLLSINVESEEAGISEEAVCIAIDFAIKEKCDLINISLGFPLYSERLYLACKKAYDNGIMIIAAAAHDNELAFPADNDYTIKIIDEEVNENSEEQVIRIYSNLYKVKMKSMCDISFDNKNSLYNVSMNSGTSIACAYFTAVLALFLQSRPLTNRDKIINELFEPNPPKVESKQLKSVYDLVGENSIFSSISSYYDCSQYTDIMNKNIIGYHDLLKNNIIKYNSDDKINCDSFDNLYLINPLQYQRKPINNELYKNINYIGNFKNTDCFLGKTLNENDILREIETPIILIAGVGSDCGKFSVQLELKKQMMANNIPPYCITYNPLGFIFDMDYLQYPSNISLNEMIYNLNGHIKNIEENEDNNYESIIINVAGGMFPLSRANTNDFGMLYTAYLNAMTTDYFIICINSTIEMPIIEREIDKLKLYGNEDISIIISDICYNDISIDSGSGIILYNETKQKNEEIVSTYSKYFPEISIFNFEDVKKGFLYNQIISSLS